jgi:putative transcriptional regulator
MNAWTAEKIRALRLAYEETQDEFRRRLDVGLGTLRTWEQGKGVPIGPAQKLLTRLQEDLDAGRVQKPAPA